MAARWTPARICDPARYPRRRGRAQSLSPPQADTSGAPRPRRPIGLASYRLRHQSRRADYCGVPEKDDERCPPACADVTTKEWDGKPDVSSTPCLGGAGSRRIAASSFPGPLDGRSDLGRELRPGPLNARKTLLLGRDCFGPRSLQHEGPRRSGHRVVAWNRA